ncbi:MAG: ornithine cyclodeaminase family protein [Candidatus Bathyarchaeota archaeon]|nr:ornithine cyclodeaminase family protein [Candidatus Bathyarchaeota archaeon]
MKIEVLLLSEQEVAGLISIQEVMDAVEQAFKEDALGYAQNPPKVYLNFPRYNGDLRVMPAYLERQDTAAVKIVSSHPDNLQKFGLPSVQGSILLIDPRNGSLLSIMDGKHITAMRTAAAGGIAAKYLANKNSKTAAFIGAGAQARTQFLALLAVCPSIKEIRVWDISQAAVENFSSDVKSKANQIRISTPNDTSKAVKGADIVVTTTPSKEPLILDDWVSEGTHFNCIGADAPGKEELDPKILKRSKIIVDNYEQACHSGEINVPLSKGIISKDDIWAEMGEVLIGKKAGRVSTREITVFDTTGIAVEDAVTARLVYLKALQSQRGSLINL